METIAKTTEERTGLGHQLQSDRRTVDSCKDSLDEAFFMLRKLKGTEIETLRTKIAAAMWDCTTISHSMEEAYNQND